MFEDFSVATQEQIKKFMAERGQRTNVPFDVVAYIVAAVPAGEARFRNALWEDEEQWVYRAPVVVGQEEETTFQMVCTNYAGVEDFWKLKPEEEDSRTWVLELLPPKILPEGEEPTFTPPTDTSRQSNQTYGQVNDAIFASYPGALAIRCEDWNNTNAWVILEEVEIKGDKLQILTINYNNGIKSPWHPSAADLRSTNWVSRNPLE